MQPPRMCTKSASTKSMHSCERSEERCKSFGSGRFEQLPIGCFVIKLVMTRLLKQVAIWLALAVLYPEQKQKQSSSLETQPQPLPGQSRILAKAFLPAVVSSVIASIAAFPELCVWEQQSTLCTMVFASVRQFVSGVTRNIGSTVGAVAFELAAVNLAVGMTATCCGIITVQKTYSTLRPTSQVRTSWQQQSSSLCLCSERTRPISLQACMA